MWPYSAGPDRPQGSLGPPRGGRLLGPSEVTWVSLNPLIATVDANGLVRGISSGSGTATTTVRVTHRGVTATAAVTVRRN